MALDYLTIGSTDIAKSRIYYDAILPLLGGTVEMEIPDQAFCIKLSNNVRIWITKPQNGEAADHGNGWTVGLKTDSEEKVKALYAAALANGGSSEGEPGPRPMYGPDFYGAYARDPDGNKMSFFYLMVAEN